MNNKDREVLKQLNTSINFMNDLLLYLSKKVVVDDLQNLFFNLEKYSIPFTIVAGYYRDHDFQFETTLDTIAFMLQKRVVDAQSVIQYLIEYYDNNDGLDVLSYEPTVAIKIINQNNMAEYVVEYDGNILSLDGLSNDN
jgi:hypothetical protein